MPNPIPQTDGIPARLRHFRDSLGLAQQAISEALGKHGPTHCSRLENGDIPLSLSDLKKLLDSFGLNPNWLLSGSGDMLSFNIDKVRTVYLSFSQQEWPVAQRLSNLLNSLGCAVYFPPSALRSSTCIHQRALFTHAIASCDALVTIISKHYPHNTHLINDAAVALTNNKPVFQALVSSAPHTFPLPLWNSPNVYTYRIDDRDQLSDFLYHLLHRVPRQESNHPLEHPRFDELVSIAKQRWVFIAGSLAPEIRAVASSSTSSPVMPHYDEQSYYRTVFWPGPPGNTITPDSSANSLSERYLTSLSTFVRTLTLKLINAGMNPSSCFRIPEVGQQVVSVAADARSTPSYNIEGVYYDEKWGQVGTYNVTSTSTSSKKIKNKQQREEEARQRLAASTRRNHFMKMEENHRMSYLSTKEALVLIGGADGTYRDYMAASQLNSSRPFPHSPKIVPIPCFGGTAFKVWCSIHENDRPTACRNCINDRQPDQPDFNPCPAERLNQLVDFIKS